MINVYKAIVLTIVSAINLSYLYKYQTDVPNIFITIGMIIMLIFAMGGFYYLASYKPNK